MHAALLHSFPTHLAIKSLVQCPIIMVCMITAIRQPEGNKVHLYSVIGSATMQQNLLYFVSSMWIKVLYVIQKCLNEYS